MGLCLIFVNILRMRSCKLGKFLYELIFAIIRHFKLLA